MEHMPLTQRYELKAEPLEHLLDAQGRRKDWLASRAGVHPSLLSHALAGRRTLSRGAAERIADALQVPFSLLFDVSESSNSRPDRRADVPAA